MPAPIRRRAVVLLASLVIALAACGDADQQSSPPPAATASALPAATASPASVFPVTLTDDEGTEVVIDAEPARIVSLTPATTEVLALLGFGDRIVATDSGSDFPESIIPLPDVADFSGVDVEQIVGLEADLVFAGGLGFTPPDVVVQLRSLGIPVVVVYAPTVEAVYEDIELVGVAVGQQAAARDIAAAMRAEIDAIAAAVDSPDRPRVFYEIGYTDATGQIFAPADDSFVAEMVTLAGGAVITTGDPVSYEIPLERLIERDPEIILLGVNVFYEPTVEQVTARPGWNVITAVREDAIIPVRDTEITRPGPRLAVGLRAMAAAIRPDVTLPAAP